MLGDFLFCQDTDYYLLTFIHGHMFGGLGILAGSIHSLACIPLSIRLHDGLQLGYFLHFQRIPRGTDGRRRLSGSKGLWRFPAPA